MAPAVPGRGGCPHGDRSTRREWCEQVLIEVVLAARSSSWRDEQLDALLISPTSFTAALLPRHLLHATVKKRLVQKLGTPQNTISATPVRKDAVNEHEAHSEHERDS